jgi:NADPH:quinone reductase-like Zn-dependent oxidoreductase
MLAVVVRAIGGPEVVEVAEVPCPVAGPGQVRIKVAAAALNPADAAVWMGVWGPVEAGQYLGVGLDAAGTVDAVGLGVARAVGAPVIAFDATIRLPVKAQAEYLVVDDFAVAPAPADMDPSLAATIPLNAMTASQALDHLPMRPRDTLLVTGAAGAVGGYAVELARTRGVRTIALGRPEDRELLLGLGATSFVPGGEDVGAAVRQLVPNGVDGLLDAAALGDAAMGAVRDGGTFVSVRLDVIPATQRGINVRHTTATPEAARLAYLSALAEVGLLTPRVARTYPLSQAAEAHARLVEGGRRGRIVLIP